MSIKKTLTFKIILGSCLLSSLALTVYAQQLSSDPSPPSSLTKDAITSALGWQQTGMGKCQGYYLEPPISSPTNQARPDMVEITSKQMLYSFHGTSESQSKTTIRRYGQEIVGDRAFLYRNPTTGKLSAIDLFGHVTLRESNTLVIAKQGRFDFTTKAPSLLDILYRIAIYSSVNPKPNSVTAEQLENTQKVYQLSAWGKADTFTQVKPKVFTLDNVSYTTCPPTQSVWAVKAKHMVLDKVAGRGTATGAKLLLKGVPIFYTPYLDFPLDHRRKSGFLWPTIRAINGESGTTFTLPYYWNMAPNYDMLLTPSIMAKRGIQLTANYRYLTKQSEGHFKIAALPHDRAFAAFKVAEEGIYGTSTDSATQAQLRHLLNASTTRKSLVWQDTRFFNDHWSSTVDYTYVSDDYYLRDLSNNIDEVTQNQLLQEADVKYKGPIWNFLGRAQSYQTLHPLNTSNPTANSYSRYPQLLLNGDYPHDLTGLDYTVSTEYTHFYIINNPGSPTKQPMGNRINIQPGISKPFNKPYAFVIPRVQFAMTKYQLGDIPQDQTKEPTRTLPIFDLSSGLNFDRNVTMFHHAFTQTLEPQAYYTYIPFRDQTDIPIFDTSLNMLSYDQLFVYNRFSGIDRIGDANQISLGVTSRLLDEETGLEKVRAGIGEIFYFENRRVTLCTTANCNNTIDTNDSSLNRRNRSPISGLIKFTLTSSLSAESDTIWDPLLRQDKLTNETLTLHYQPEANKILNFGYTFVRNGDSYQGDKINKTSNNLSQTDISGAWPIFSQWSAVGRWTQNLNRHNFQNLLLGVQYDTCCWAVRFIAGKQFYAYSANNTAQYNPEVFLQFAFKGLGNFGTGDPTQTLVNSVSGYSTQFGQDY